MSLTCGERKAVVEASVSAAARRVPVIVQVGHNSLADARDLASHAQHAGADVISATCPSYFKIGDVETLVQCMQQLAGGASELPFYYYHIPALTGSPINVVEFLQRGGERIANLAGLKYTTTLVHEYQSCLQLDGGRFDVVWGCDEMLLSAWASGAKAAIGSTYNLAAPLYRQIIRAVDTGELETARQLQYRSVSLVRVMMQFSFHAALKRIMEMLGMPGGPCRLPLKSLQPEELASLARKLDEIEFFTWCGHPRACGGPAV
jgi:N-acetylneuraminate lyase